jgi:hypothetical protein
MSTSTTLAAAASQRSVIDTIQFFAKTLNGSSITFRESRCTTGGQFKVRLEAKPGIPASQQRLNNGSTEIQDSGTLQEISLPDNGTIHLSLSLNGGMKKGNTQKQT